MRLKKFDSINVVPFIDIMLVLLAIVLTTATFIAQGNIKVALPEARNTQSASDQKKAEIIIDSQGRLYFNSRPVDLEQLEAALEGYSPADMFVLRTDEKSEFHYFVKVIDLLKSKKLENVAIATVRP